MIIRTEDKMRRIGVNETGLQAYGQKIPKIFIGNRRLGRLVFETKLLKESTSNELSNTEINTLKNGPPVSTIDELKANIDELVAARQMQKLRDLKREIIRDTKDATACIKDGMALYDAATSLWDGLGQLAPVDRLVVLNETITKCEDAIFHFELARIEGRKGERLKDAPMFKAWAENLKAHAEEHI